MFFDVPPLTAVRLGGTGNTRGKFEFPRAPWSPRLRTVEDGGAPAKSDLAVVVLAPGDVVVVTIGSRGGMALRLMWAPAKKIGSTTAVDVVFILCQNKSTHSKGKSA